MIQLFVSDLDGTLALPKHPGIDEKILSCFDQVMKQGKEIAIASGRNITELKTERALWEKNIYFIAMNGALILGKNKEVIQKKCMDPQVLDFLLQEYPTYAFEYLGADAKWCLVSKEVIIENYRNTFPEIMQSEGVDQLMEAIIQYNQFDCSKEYLRKQEIYKIDYPSIRLEENEKLIEALRLKFSDEVAIAYDGQSIEITMNGVDKGSALKSLCHTLNLKQDEVAVFGDSGNDITMLKAFPYSYAVENAKENVKKVANHVIGKCSDYAVIQKIEELCENNEDHK